MRRIIHCILALFALSIALLYSSPVYASTILGDSNVEPVTSTLVSQYVMALTKFTITQATTIQSVSLYLQYNGSDGSQCIKFGVYGDNGGSYGQSSPLSQALIASTHNGYCLQKGDFGPAWETWTLLPGDNMMIPSAGTYWLCTLALQGYGTIYHYTYTGSYGGQNFYQYGYFHYGFPASYALGFPPGPFGMAMIYPSTQYIQIPYNLILPFNTANIGEFDAPYSFYATGT